MELLKYQGWALQKTAFIATTSRRTSFSYDLIDTLALYLQFIALTGRRDMILNWLYLQKWLWINRTIFIQPTQLLKLENTLRSQFNTLSELSKYLKEHSSNYKQKSQLKWSILLGKIDRTKTGIGRIQVRDWNLIFSNFLILTIPLRTLHFLVFKGIDWLPL